MWTRIDKVYRIAATGIRFNLRLATRLLVRIRAILLHDTSLIFYGTKYLTEEKGKVA